MSQAKNNFAYVSYVGTNERDIVPITDIKNFREDQHDPKKKYKIRWNEKWYYGTIVFFGETEEEVREEAENHRPKIIPENLLLSNTDDDSADEAIGFNKKGAEKKCDSLRQRVLNKKVHELKNNHQKSKLDGNNNNTRPDKNSKTTPEINESEFEVEASIEVEINEQNPKNIMETQNDLQLEASVKNTKTRNVIETRRVGLENCNDQEKMEDLVEEVKNLKIEVGKLKLKNEKLLAKNTEAEKMLKDSECLNIDLQKEVINIVQEMKVQLSQLTNRSISIPQNDEELGYPEVAFKKNDNSIHLGRGIWLNMIYAL